MDKKEQILREQLAKESMTGLVAIFNGVTPGKTVKRFTNKQTGIDRIAAIGMKRIVQIVANLKALDDEKQIPTKVKTRHIKKGASDLIDLHKSLFNSEFAKLPKFKHYCELAHIEPHKRQASKFRNLRGLAYLAV